MNKYQLIIEMEAEGITLKFFEKAFDQIETLPTKDFEKRFTLIDLTNKKVFTGQELREILGAR